MKNQTILAKYTLKPFSKTDRKKTTPLKSWGYCYMMESFCHLQGSKFNPQDSKQKRNKNLPLSMLHKRLLLYLIPQSAAEELREKWRPPPLIFSEQLPQIHTGCSRHVTCLLTVLLTTLWEKNKTPLIRGTVRWATFVESSPIVTKYVYKFQSTQSLRKFVI